MEEILWWINVIPAIVVAAFISDAITGGYFMNIIFGLGD